MNHHKIPVREFVATTYLTPMIQKIVEGWRVESKHVVEILTENFHDMGIYHVIPGHEPILIRNMIFQLKNSPEIMAMVARVRQEEMRRMRTRHAE